MLGFYPGKLPKLTTCRNTDFVHFYSHFFCIFIQKISGFSCVSTNLISCLNRSRLGMCYCEQFITGLCTKMYNYCLHKMMYYCLQKIKPTACCPQTNKLCYMFQMSFERFGHFGSCENDSWGETQQASLSVVLVLLKISPMISITCSI